MLIFKQNLINKGFKQNLWILFYIKFFDFFYDLRSEIFNFGEIKWIHDCGVIFEKFVALVLVFVDAAVLFMRLLGDLKLSPV